MAAQGPARACSSGADALYAAEQRARTPRSLARGRRAARRARPQRLAAVAAGLRCGGRGEPAADGLLAGGRRVGRAARRPAATALAAAVEAGGEQLPAPSSAARDAVVAKVAERTALSGDHTVVALRRRHRQRQVHLFNALVGTPVATVGVRRPTTVDPDRRDLGRRAGRRPARLARRRRPAPVVPAEAAARTAGGPVGSLDGLVLLDLPDFDSRETGNRTEAERRARARRPVRVGHRPAEVRRRPAARRLRAPHWPPTRPSRSSCSTRPTGCSRGEVAQCRADLVRLMERDGVPRATVLATSVTTGDGLDELRQRLANAVAGRTHARARLAGDVPRRPPVSRPRPSPSASRSSTAARATELLDALARSAGIPTVVEAVERDYRMEAAASTGWPFTRWVQRLRPRPLRRLRLDGRDPGRPTPTCARSLGRSSLPPPSPAARAAVDLATRRLGDDAAAGLPHPLGGCRGAGRPARRPRPRRRARPGVVATSLVPGAVLVAGHGRPPARAGRGRRGRVPVARRLSVLGWFHLPEPSTPSWGPLPVPFLLLAGWAAARGAAGAGLPVLWPGWARGDGRRCSTAGSAAR